VKSIFSLILFWGLLSNAHSAFVSVKDGRFVRNGKPYYFVGTNLWYGMNLGTVENAGNRERLVRELDRLQSLGIKNLRILAATEGPSQEPWRIVPALQNSVGAFDESLLVGLDFLLSEMNLRGMTAVVCLNNFWPWSGGMSQYLFWYGAGPIPYPPPQPWGNWYIYQRYTAQFYSNRNAIKASHNLIKLILERRNSINGLIYKDDPTIMSWQLANEPRGVNNTVKFQEWIDATALYIKNLDSNHLVTTGSEGETPWPDSSGLNFVRNHSSPHIDYTTAHIWVQNWGVYDPEDAEGTFNDSVNFMKAYLQDHIQKSKSLNKPLVLEEFGISRDRNSHNPLSSTYYRDRYYRAVFETVYAAALSEEPIGGVNFWAWSGEAYPLQPYGGYWKAGFPFLGDPPHESQGWYSVYDTDESTKKVVSEFALKMSEL